MKEMFDVILDKDEEIIKVYKPNKKRYITIHVLFVTLINILISAGTLVLSILAFSGVIELIDEGVDTTKEFAITMLGISIFFLLAILAVVIVALVQYQKTYYAYSNKRILIRTGFIGIDFTVLEMKLIGTTAIKVGLLDKFVRPNTGTIRFGSNSTPIGGSNANQMGGLVFKHIDDAYKTYRDIKEVVDAHVR